MKRGYYLIAYDITKNKKRKKVADLLLEIGTRINKSVFICMDDAAHMKTLKEKLTKYTEKKDSICIIPLCKTCYESGEFLHHKEEVGSKKYTKFV